MNSRQSRSFTVHCLRGTRKKPKKVHFRPSGTGLFYFDASADLTSTFPRFSPNHEECLLRLRNESFVANTINVTVEENLAGFSARQRTAFKNARRVYKALGHPSFDNFLRVIKSNYIKNLPVSEANAKNMISAYWPGRPCPSR